MNSTIWNETGDRGKEKKAGFRWLRILIPVLMLLGMVVAMTPAPASYAAQRSQTIPDNVLMASVRIVIYVLVTPSRSGDPFLCMLDDQTVLEVGNGSGTIVTPDGYVLTNRHVTDTGRVPGYIAEYCEQQVRGGGSTEFVEVVWLPDERGTPTTPFLTELVKQASESEDMAILKLVSHIDGSPITEDLPVVEFGDSDALREPESIFIIGYPANAGVSRRVSEGIFSGWGDNGYGVQWIYTDATISGGNSGGTAVNADGLFVGIPTLATSSDCREGDTNNDGVVDEQDQGCIGIGGNYGILIPGNIARDFIQTTLRIDIPVVEGTGSNNTEPPPTEERPQPTEIPDDGAMVGDIVITAYDANEEQLDGFNDVAQLQGCFENLGLQAGDTGTITWFRDGNEVLTYEFTWDDAWNPEACASIWNDDGTFLEAGAYSVEVTVNGVTATSSEVTVTTSEDGPFAAVAIEGRTTDRERVAPDSNNVLAGEFNMLYVTVSGPGLQTGAIWQIMLYRDGDLIDSSRPKVWSADPAEDATVRFRPDDATFPAGDYDAMLVVNDIITVDVSFSIEG